MKFTAILFAAGLAVASPVKREVGGILMCEGVNATGTCVYEALALNTCHDRPAALTGIETFAVDGDNFACFPRAVSCEEICTSPTGCTNGALDFTYVNKYNMSAINWGGPMIKSYRCYDKSNPNGV